MPQVDLSWLNILSETALAVPAWQVGAIGALVAVIGLLAMRRARSIWLGGVLRIFVVLIAGAATRAYFQMAAGSKRDQERRLLEERNAELTARSLVPGTPFACLDASAGEAVETGCEKAVFARPETAAASVAYVTARLALLSDGLKFAGRGDPAFAEKLAGARRAIELDRYGIVAHILMTRDGCTPDDCADFGLMRDLAAIKANMMAQAY